MTDAASNGMHGEIVNRVPPMKIALVPSGDEPASVEGLYRRYAVVIRRLVERQFGAGPPDPEDAVQAAFERFARLEDYSKVEDPYAFLARSARNFVLDYHRAAKVRRNHSLYEVGETGGDFDAERVLSGKERLSVIEAAVRAMDPRRREVLIMNRIHGLSCAEIARRLGCSQTLVKLRLAEAVVMCQRALRTAEGEG